MDPISDFFIRIKNAQRAGHETVQISYSKFKHEISKALERSGLVGGVEKRGKRVRKIIEIGLIYRDARPAISDLKLISRPSRRIYSAYKDLKPIRGGGIIFLSTPKGVLSWNEAKKAKVGGEVIVEIQ